MIGIYMITSPSKKIYIGQSINIEKRFSKYKTLDCKNQIILYNSLKKYGFDNHKFEILCECEILELNDKERYYQDIYSAMSIYGLNCKLTKSNDKNGILSEETKLKISISNKGNKLSNEAKLKIKNAALGKKHSEETKLKMSLSRIGRKGPMLDKNHSEETKIKMSNNSSKFWLGKNRDSLTKEKISKKLIGFIVSEETKIKISNSSPKYWKGKNLSKEHKDKLSFAKIGKVSNNTKILIDISNGVFYNSVREASLIYGIKETTLCAQLKGINKSKTNLRYA